MILTVTCNPALDTTYQVDGFIAGGVNRVRRVTVVPGGKGVNVSRILAQMGEPTTATGIADNYFGPHLHSHGVSVDFVEGLDLVRRTVVVHDHAGETTSLWEPGYPAGPGAQAALIDKVTSLLSCADALVVSGSLAPGLGHDLPVRLAQAAHGWGLPALLDVDGRALQHAVAAPAVVLPNEEEFRRLVGSRGVVDIVAAVRALGRSAPTVVTLGRRGMVAVTDEGAWHAEPPEALAGNPTGAGDAATAAIALGLARGMPWPDIVREAVAVSGAAVVAHVAGEYDEATYYRWRREVPVRQITRYEMGEGTC